jgi:hypothetical protein
MDACAKVSDAPRESGLGGAASLQDSNSGEIEMTVNISELHEEGRAGSRSESSCGRPQDCRELSTLSFQQVCPVLRFPKLGLARR